MPPLRRGIAATLFALEGDGALLRVVEPVDDVEHRRLARAIRPDDRADLALHDVEAKCR
jgi:hypothetical protein